VIALLARGAVVLFSLNALLCDIFIKYNL